MQPIRNWLCPTAAPNHAQVNSDYPHRLALPFPNMRKLQRGGSVTPNKREFSVKGPEKRDWGRDTAGQLLAKSMKQLGQTDPVDAEEQRASQIEEVPSRLKPVKLPNYLRHTIYGDGLALSTLLSALNTEFRPPFSASHKIVDCLIDNGLTQETIDLYNAYFGTEGMPLRLTLDKTRAMPDVPAQNVPVALWKLLTSYEPARMRRCPVCQVYFFDRTRTRKKEYCSRRCSSIVTSRAYRAAGKERAKRAEKRVTHQRKNTTPH